MTAPSLYERLGGVSSIANVVDGFIDRIMVDELNLSEGLFGDFWLATDAYIYGYPLVTMEMTRRVFTNVARPEGTHAPPPFCGDPPSSYDCRRTPAKCFTHPGLLRMRKSRACTAC